MLTTRILNFFQASKYTFFWSSLLAILLAMISFPVWQEVFSMPDVPVKVQMAAPGATYIRVYWDDSTKHPDAYERVVAKPGLQSRKWQVKVEALAQKQSEAKAAQVWILDVATPENKVDWTKAEMQPIAWQFMAPPLETVAPADAKIVMSQGEQPQSLIVPIEGSQLTIQLLRHPWSGQVRITANSQQREFDLFAPADSLPETVTFESVLPGKARAYRYEINVVNTAWHRLKFVGEGDKAVIVKSLSVQGKTIKAQSDGTFVLPYHFLNRDTQALIASAISYIWILVIFISAVHLWQGSTNRRFGFATWAILLSATLAGFWTLVFYPGLMTVDSVSQWLTAKSLLAGEKGGTFWFGSTISLLMAMSFTVFREYGFFTFIQLFLYYLSCILLIQRFFETKFLIVITCLFILIPTIWNQAVLVGRDTWTATAINFALLSLFWLSEIPPTRWRTSMPFVVTLLVSCTLMIGLRPNSLTVFPVLILLSWKLLPTLKWKLFCICCCLFSIFCSQWLTNITLAVYQKEKVDVAAASVIWEHIGILKQLDDPQITAKYNVDFVGNTQLAIEKFDCLSHNSLIFFDPPLSQKKIIMEESKRVKSAFVSLVSAYPIDFLRNKLCIYKTLLGLDNQVPLYIVGTGYPIYDNDETTKLVKSTHRLVYQPKIPNWGDYFVQKMAVAFSSPFPFFTPWTIILLGCLVWSLVLFFQISCWLFSSLMLAALSYYGGYFLLTPGLHFRYFFPSYTLIVIAILCGICKIILRYSDYNNKRVDYSG